MHDCCLLKVGRGYGRLSQHNPLGRPEATIGRPYVMAHNHFQLFRKDSLRAGRVAPCWARGGPSSLLPGAVPC